MKLGLFVKDLLQGGRWKFAFSGALLGVYFNVLHSVFFMVVSDFFVVAGLSVFSVVALCVFGVVMGLEEPKPRAKLWAFLFGANLSSVVFAIIYFLEVFVGDFVFEVLKNPLYFPASRVPVVSFFASLFISGVLSSVQVLSKRKKGHC